jgi:hypothetical protein
MELVNVLGLIAQEADYLGWSYLPYLARRNHVVANEVAARPTIPERSAHHQR